MLVVPTLQPIAVPALEEDSCHVLEAVSDGRAQIDSLSALTETMETAGPDAIILFQRAVLAKNFLEEIQQELLTSTMMNSDGFRRWNSAGGESAKNALPHVHDFCNCHAAPTPNDCPTGFFRHRDMVRAVEEVAEDRQIAPFLADQLRSALSLRQSSGDKKFYRSLHNLRLTPDCSATRVLQCAEVIQRKIRAWGGAFEASLDSDGYGILSIPAWCVHARSLRKQLQRRQSTGWRYFGMPSFRTAFTSLPEKTSVASMPSPYTH